MGLVLVGSWRNLRGLQELLDLLNGEVADTDAADLSCHDELLESLPGIGNWDICQPEPLSNGVCGGEGVIRVLESNRPMDLEYQLKLQISSSSITIATR